MEIVVASHTRILPSGARQAATPANKPDELTPSPCALLNPRIASYNIVEKAVVHHSILAHPTSTMGQYRSFDTVRRTTALISQADFTDHVVMSQIVPGAVIAAVRRTKRYGKSSRSSAETSSLRFDVGRPDHLAPLLCFFADELAEVGGRARERRRT